LKGEAQIVVAPAEAGEIGVMERHTPLLTTLKAGEVRVKEGEKMHYIFVNEGFLQTAENTLFILAEQAEFAEEINIESVYAEKERIERELAEKERKDFVKLEASLKKVLAMLKVAKRVQ
jgi:F-type H+-transporting ATPase subunit epsilon